MNNLNWFVKSLAAATLALLAAAILLPMFARWRENDGHRKVSCQSNLVQNAFGLKQYSWDYDKHFPPVSLSNGERVGWADVIQPYTKSTQILQCPLEKGWPQNPSPHQRGYTDYWMNANLAGAKQSAIRNPAATILSGDGNDGADANDSSYALSSLPPSWILDKQSPAYRHGAKRTDTGIGANYAFADGHFKMLKPGEIAANAGNNKPSFAVR